METRQGGAVQSQQWWGQPKCTRIPFFLADLLFFLFKFLHAKHVFENDATGVKAD